MVVSITRFQYLSIWHVYKGKRSRRKRSTPSPNLEKVAKRLIMKSAVEMGNLTLDSEDRSDLLKDIYMKLCYPKSNGNRQETR